MKEITKIAIYLKHHLIKNNQILAIEKLIPKELYSLSIVLKNELPTSQKYCSKTVSSLQVQWKEISYHKKFQLTLIHVCSNIKYWTIFYILVSSFLLLIKKKLNCDLTVDYTIKQLITFLWNGICFQIMEWCETLFSI